MKKTRHGQPVMKYRREHLLESIEKSAENYGSRTSWPPHFQDNLAFSSGMLCRFEVRICSFWIGFASISPLVVHSFFFHKLMNINLI